MKPQLSFSGYSEGWEQDSFSSLFDMLPNNTLSRDKLSGEGKVKNIHYGDVLIKYGESLNTSKDDVPYVKDIYYVPTKEYVLRSGDVIFSDAAEDSTVGKCCELVGSSEDMIVAGLHTIATRPKNSFYPKFLAFYLNSNAFHNQLLPLIQGTKISSISRKALNSTTVRFPNIEEQRRISQFFHAQTSQIESLGVRIEKLRQLKAASLQAMFPQDGETTPRLRFKGFDGEWKPIQIGKVASFSKGSGYSKSDIRADGNPIILYGRMYTDYSVTISNVDTFALPKTGNILSKKGDIIVPASGETPEDIAVASVVNEEGVILGGDINIIRVDNQVINPIFLALSLTFTKTQRKLSALAQGKSVVHLNNANIANTCVELPCLKEQTKIADFFLNLDTQIKLTEKKLEKLRQIKASCLDLMFV